MEKHWYIKYNSKYSEQDFETLIGKLEKIGYRKVIHCDIPITYAKFKEYGVIRSITTWRDYEKTISVDSTKQDIDFEYDFTTIISPILKEAEYLAQEGKSKKPESVAGKWYRCYKGCDHHFYAKYRDTLDGVWRATEFIFKDGSHDKVGGGGGYTQDYERELLTDLSEIQQYLPEGHVDLIVKDEKIPENYIILLNSHGSPFSVGSLQKIESIRNNNAIVDGYYFPKETYREATPEEIASVAKPKDEIPFGYPQSQNTVTEDPYTEQELIDEAIRRGFVEGAVYQTVPERINTIQNQMWGGQPDFIVDGEPFTLYTENTAHIEKLEAQASAMVSGRKPITQLDVMMAISQLEKIDNYKKATQQDEQPILISKVKTSNKIIVL